MPTELLKLHPGCAEKLSADLQDLHDQVQTSGTIRSRREEIRGNRWEEAEEEEGEEQV